MVGIGAFIAAAAIQTNRAGDILARSQDILGKATTIAGSFTQKFGKGVGKGDFYLKKGNKAFVYSDFVTEISDGIFRTTIDNKEKTYRVQDSRVYNVLYMPGFEAFSVVNGKSLFTRYSEDAVKNNALPEPRDLQMAQLDGRDVATYIINGSQVYLDASTALPIGADFNGENGQKVQMRFQNIHLDVAVDDSIFQLQPGQGTLREEKVVERGMLKVGDNVPSSFINEATALLHKYMTGKKTSIILFLDDKNAADSDLLMKFDSLVKKLPKTVGIIGVARTKDWQKLFKGKPKFPLIIDAELPSDSVASRFGIVYYPTLYIVEDAKTVKYVQIGSGTADLDPVLKGLGIAQP